MFGSLGLGILTLLRGQSLGGKLVVWLISIESNYIPLLRHAISVVRHGTASQEIADEMPDKKRMFRKYRRQSVLLLVAFVIPILAMRHPSDRKFDRGISCLVHIRLTIKGQPSCIANHDQ